MWALGVPQSAWSCHTALIGDYFIEGHVPASDIRRLLAEKPLARGLAVPEMPVGSPGMEAPGQKSEPYETILVLADGTSRVWQSTDGATPSDGASQFWSLNGAWKMMHGFGNGMMGFNCWYGVWGPVPG